MIIELEEGDVLYITTPNGTKFDVSVKEELMGETLEVEEV